MLEAAQPGEGVALLVGWQCRRLRRQRLTKGVVEMDGSSGDGECGRGGAAGEGAEIAQRVIGLLRRRDLYIPLGLHAVEPLLINRLGGAAVAQLMRAVGGQYQQGYVAEVGLHHSWQKVGGSRARGADKRDRLAQPLRQAQPKVSGGALVYMRPDADAL